MMIIKYHEIFLSNLLSIGFLRHSHSLPILKDDFSLLNFPKKLLHWKCQKIASLEVPILVNLSYGFPHHG